MFAGPLMFHHASGHGLLSLLNPVLGRVKAQFTSLADPPTLARLYLLESMNADAVDVHIQV